MHSLHQIAIGTPSHVPPRRRVMIIAIFHDFGTRTNCMVPQDWDSAPRCVYGPNVISDSIGESPIFSAARFLDFNDQGVSNTDGGGVVKSVGLGVFLVQNGMFRMIQKNIEFDFCLCHILTSWHQIFEFWRRYFDFWRQILDTMYLQGKWGGGV